MNKNYYVFSSGTLKREDDTLRLDTDKGDLKRIPIKKVDAVYLFGQVTYNTKLLGLLNKHTVELHIFGWNDQYVGSHIPRKGVKSGETVIKQVESYQQPKRKYIIAREFVVSSIHNMKKNLQYYNNRGRNLDEEIKTLESIINDIPSDYEKIEKLMGYEAQARKEYYSTFNKILQTNDFTFDKREYNPPSDKLNALISFVNMMVYSSVTSAIRQTALDPTIGFLHKPGNRRNTLALDIADIFKPIIADRCIFRLINRNQLTADDFEGTSLTDSARKTVISEYEEILQDTIEHPDLEQHRSYKHLLKFEAYKLKKHILMGEEYSGFKRWW